VHQHPANALKEYLATFMGRLCSEFARNAQMEAKYRSLPTEVIAAHRAESLTACNDWEKLIVLHCTKCIAAMQHMRFSNRFRLTICRLQEEMKRRTFRGYDHEPDPQLPQLAPLP
jgi:hypothetical protein